MIVKVGKLIVSRGLKKLLRSSDVPRAFRPFFDDARGRRGFLRMVSLMVVGYPLCLSLQVTRISYLSSCLLGCRDSRPICVCERQAQAADGLACHAAPRLSRLAEPDVGWQGCRTHTQARKPKADANSRPLGAESSSIRAHPKRHTAEFIRSCHGGLLSLRGSCGC